ncbi:MAG: ribosomal protein S18-alanine N-acetyltransferase [Chloroflexi bacterium]|nr:ribosomal protein S18-alanine N-acetyltransferase [Chloroflexota bacterium]
MASIDTSIDSQTQADTRPHVIVRQMRLPDIDEVLTLDRLSFPTAWPARTYRYEITSNPRSTMIVLEDANQAEGRPDGLRGLFRYLLSGAPGHVPQSGPLVAYCGMWQIIDEAHVSTIAVHPRWRGNKLGELMMWTMVRRAIRHQAVKVTLEVRVSNYAAQALYRKYGFEVMSVRKKYYRDNGEDAYNMMVTPLDGAYREKMITFGRELSQYIRVTDEL